MTDRSLSEILANQSPAVLTGRKRGDPPPPPWETGLPKTFELVRGVPVHIYTPLLPHIERMAAQGITRPTIAARFGWTVEELNAAADTFADVRAALEGGRARGVEEVSGAQYRNAVAGDSAAAAAYLKGVGEWSSGGTPAGTASVTINVSSAPAQQGKIIDVAAEMARRQFSIDFSDEEKEAFGETTTRGGEAAAVTASLSEAEEMALLLGEGEEPDANGSAGHP